MFDAAGEAQIKYDTSRTHLWRGPRAGAWMLGRTPPCAMVTTASSLLSFSLFLHGRGLIDGLANETNDSPDGELEVPGDDARLLVAAHGVGDQLEDLAQKPGQHTVTIYNAQNTPVPWQKRSLAEEEGEKGEREEEEGEEEGGGGEDEGWRWRNAGPHLDPDDHRLEHFLLGWQQPLARLVQGGLGGVSGEGETEEGSRKRSYTT